jgi:hypothetical protein
MREVFCHIGDFMQIPVSIGEVIDKITILEIKKTRIKDSDKLININTELTALKSAVARENLDIPELANLTSALLEINIALWEIEDRIRELERQKNFDASFVEVARSVYRSNDERSRIKRQINDLTGSAVVEEKSYQAY